MKKSYLIGFLIILILVVFNTAFVFASEFNEESADIIAIGGRITDSEFQHAFKTANLSFGIDRDDALIVPYKNGENVVAIAKQGVLYIDKTVWNNISQNQLAKSMHFFMRGLESQESKTNKQDIIDFMKDLQTCDDNVNKVIFVAIYSEFKADMTTTYNITKPMFPILNIILGVAAVVLIVLLLVYTVTDLMYIALPIWRDFDISRGGKPCPFVSYEAVFVVMEKEKHFDEYSNIYLSYFLKRSWTYILLAICITYLIGGGLSGIISFILGLVSGFTGG